MSASTNNKPCPSEKTIIQANMRKIISLILITALLICSACHKDETKDIRYKIKKAELSTVEYTVRQIIRNSDETWKLLGDKKVLLSVKATVKAGIDLEQVTDSDIKIDGKKARLTLPKAKIMTINIKPKDITIAYSKVGALRKKYSQKEIDEILRAGEYAIRTDQDLRQSIISEAENNAKDFFELLLKSNGFNDIEITFNAQ